MVQIHCKEVEIEPEHDAPFAFDTVVNDATRAASGMVAGTICRGFSVGWYGNGTTSHTEVGKPVKGLHDDAGKANATRRLCELYHPDGVRAGSYPLQCCASHAVAACSHCRHTEYVGWNGSCKPTDYRQVPKWGHTDFGTGTLLP